MRRRPRLNASRAGRRATVRCSRPSYVGPTQLPEPPERPARPEPTRPRRSPSAQLSAARRLSRSASSRSSQLSCRGPSSAGSASSASGGRSRRAGAARPRRRPLGQPLERVLADRLQHPEARLAARHRLRPEQAVVEQRLDAGEHVELEVAGNRLRGVEREAADEDGQAREERLLRRAQEVVAPGDGGAQRPVPLGPAVAGLGLQQRQPLAQALEDRLRREQLGARGRELDRKREPVETQAELGDRAGVGSESRSRAGVACRSTKSRPPRAAEAVDVEGPRASGSWSGGTG